MIEFRPTLTRRASLDGLHVRTFIAGRSYRLSEDELARAFPRGGYEVVEPVPEGAPEPEAKALGAAPENKAVGRESRRAKWLRKKGEG